MEYQSPLSMLQYWEKETPHKIYLKQPVNGEWQTWTWEQVAQEVRQLAAALQSLSLPGNSHIEFIDVKELLIAQGCIDALVGNLDFVFYSTFVFWLCHPGGQ